MTSESRLIDDVIVRDEPTSTRAIELEEEEIDITEFTVNTQTNPRCTAKRKSCYKRTGIMTFVTVAIALAVCLIVTGAVRDSDVKQEKDSAYWTMSAHRELRKALNVPDTMRKARNVIMFIGDGMGPTTVTAGRILEGQKLGKYGEEHRLSFDNFPHTGLAVTYSLDAQVTDSASSATAFTAGVKTNQRLIGLGPKAIAKNCTASKGQEVDTILDWFIKDGRAAGFVTTTAVTHATPAALYAHSADRFWEVDTFMPAEAKEEGCKDIGLQLIQDNPEINVMLGGGENAFKPLNNQHPRPTTSPFYRNLTRGRKDNQDLTQVWQDKKKSEKKKHKYVTSRSELNAVDAKNTDYLFGIFSEFDMDYDIDRDDNYEPSLAEMTEKAIQVLKNNPHGFFLMVEGGRIDHGHHFNQPSKALHDTIAFAKAVEVAVRMTSESDTQILVTADHSHTMSIAGYPKRGSNILDKNDGATDGMPYTTLVYGNGPGYSSPRTNLTGVDTMDKEYLSQSAVPLMVDTHGGEDVAMYARGPQAHLYSGVHENNYIPIVMAYAACVGPYERDEDCAASMVDNSAAVKVSSLTVLTIAINFILHVLRN